jgi:hypothetical protein
MTKTEHKITRTTGTVLVVVSRGGESHRPEKESEKESDTVNFHGGGADGYVKNEG